jgi:hypothetical protein
MSAAVSVVVPLVAGMAAAACVVAPRKNHPRGKLVFEILISTEPALRAKARFLNQQDLLIRV